MVKLLLGKFSFLNIEENGKQEAIIHEIQSIVECETTEEAEELGEKYLVVYDSYLIPELYEGSINLTQLELKN